MVRTYLRSSPKLSMASKTLSPFPLLLVVIVVLFSVAIFITSTTAARVLSEKSQTKGKSGEVVNVKATAAKEPGEHIGYRALNRTRPAVPSKPGDPYGHGCKYYVRCHFKPPAERVH
ncbi:hypothetical protein Taro_035863 [Colocasia esculenta]|uniref:Uncharacterized protein n=1 Tax=Colocasia esculenta TaxID=4460 RepID=A0A843WBQ3_COLES|nr:hypothetical protein [Colocasia esculenta]